MFTAASCGAMAAEKSDKTHCARGRREMRDITIETYSRESEEERPRGLIPGSESSVKPQTHGEGTVNKLMNSRMLICLKCCFHK